MHFVLLALIVFLIIRLYMVLGRRDFSFFSDYSEPEEGDGDNHMVKPQWHALQNLDRSITEARVIADLIAIFKRVHRAFATMSFEELDLAPHVRESLAQVFADRGDHELNCEIMQEPTCTITQITIDDNRICHLEAMFTSQQIVQITNSKGEVIDNPSAIIEEITNYWVFEYDFNQEKKHWTIVEMS